MPTFSCYPYISRRNRFDIGTFLNAENRYIPPIVQPSNRGLFTEKIAIIGAGPAGLSCAYYLAEKGYQPTVFEKNKRPGGMLVYGIPSYKLEKLSLIHILYTYSIYD